MNENTLHKITVIKKSAEIVLEHCSSRGFNDGLIERGIKNILSMSKSVLEDVEREATEWGKEMKRASLLDSAKDVQRGKPWESKRTI